MSSFDNNNNDQNGQQPQPGNSQGEPNTREHGGNAQYQGAQSSYYQQPVFQQPYDQQQNGFPPPPPPYYQAPKTNGKSITALVLGICSLFIPCLGLLAGIAGIIVSALSFKELKKTGEQGRGLSVAGLVCSILGTLFWAVLFIFYLVIFLFAINESSNNYYYY